MAEFAQTPVSDGTVVVRVTGEIDLAVTADLTAAVRPHFQQGRTVEVDLGGLTFIDSSGMGVLVQLLKESTRQGARLVLTQVPRPARRLFEVSGLAGFFDIRPAVEDSPR